jgi:8-oxo-dGTP pyrophosphatase MutT (NUDIX family)
MIKDLKNSGQMYKVFFNDRTVFLGTLFKESLLKDSLHFEIENRNDVLKAWKIFLKDAEGKDLYLSAPDVDQLRQFFFSHFKIIEAAGGIVLNQQKELLSIIRWGKWDLPKGKIEKNESKELAALREVEEECGISGLALGQHKTTTYHIYPSPNNEKEFILKPTYWFSMEYYGKEILKPQLSEDITHAQWLNKQSLIEARENTYTSLKELFEID